VKINEISAKFVYIFMKYGEMSKSLLLHRGQSLGSIILRVVPVELAGYVVHLLVYASSDENTVLVDIHRRTKIPNLI